jgi:hypothetical protein
LLNFRWWKKWISWYFQSEWFKKLRTLIALVDYSMKIVLLRDRPKNVYIFQTTSPKIEARDDSWCLCHLWMNSSRFGSTQTFFTWMESLILGVSLSEVFNRRVWTCFWSNFSDFRKSRFDLGLVRDLVPENRDFKMTEILKEL